MHLLAQIHSWNHTRNLTHKHILCIQKQPLEVFYKKKLFLKISQYSQEKTCVAVPFLIKLQALRPATLLKTDSSTGIFLWILRNFKNIYFGEHMRTAASVDSYLLFYNYIQFYNYHLFDPEPLKSILTKYLFWWLLKF